MTHFSSNWGRRGAVALATTSLVVAGLGFTTAPAHAADPAPAAGGWLASQLTNGLVHNNQFDFDDLGLSADVALALAAVGGADATVTQIADAIAPRAKTEWYTSEFGGIITTYGGSLAKAAVLATTAKQDPKAWGGENLVALLEQQVADAAPIAGRVENTNDSFGDANVFGQAYAVRALSTAGSAEAAASVDFLLKQQCAGGFFRLNFTTDKAAVGQDCVDGAAGSEPDTDATAIAVQELVALKSTNAKVTAAIAKSVAWLKASQGADGSFGGGTTTEAANSNSTGLAAAVLASQGECVAAGRAANWVRELQVPAGTTGALASEAGAVAYDKAALTTAQSGGIAVADQDQWRRATTQSALGLASTLSRTAGPWTGPAGYVRAGSSQTLTLTGVTAGDNVCLTDANGVIKAVRATGTTAATTVKVPAGTGSTVYKAAWAGGESAFTIKALDKLVIKPLVAKKIVHKGQKQRIVVKGLAASELVVVRVNGKRVAKGLSTSAGKFVAKFKMTRKLSTKKKAKVKVVGEFRDLRNGTAKFKVLPKRTLR